MDAIAGFLGALGGKMEGGGWWGVGGYTLLLAVDELQN